MFQTNIYSNTRFLMCYWMLSVFSSGYFYFFCSHHFCKLNDVFLLLATLNLICLYSFC